MPARGQGSHAFVAASPTTSFNELLQQVEALKLANARLQSELAGDSSNVARLENEAAQRKDALLLMLDRSSEGGCSRDAAESSVTARGAGSLGSPRSGTGLSSLAGSPRSRLPRSMNGSPARTASAAAQLPLASCEILNHGSAAVRQASCPTGNLPLLTKHDQGAASLQRPSARHVMETDGDYHAAAERLRSWAGSDSNTEAVRNRGSASTVDCAQQLYCGSARAQEDARVKKEKRDSGTFDHAELERDGLLLCDASTNTATMAEAFIPKLCMEVDKSRETGLTTCGPHGTAVVTIATQTHDVIMSQNGKGPERVECPVNRDIPKPFLSSVYHGAWPIVPQGGRWNLHGLGLASVLSGSGGGPETQSVISFHSGMSSSHHSSTAPGKNMMAAADSALEATASAAGDCDGRADVEQRHLGTKVEVVYSLLSMLGTHDPDDASRTLLAMSNSPDSCVAMRQTGCLPLLVQLLHGSVSAVDRGGENARGRPPPLAVAAAAAALTGPVCRAGRAARSRASRALRNIVRSHPDEKKGWREARVLHNLEAIRRHCDRLRCTVPGGNTEEDVCSSDDDDPESSAVWRSSSSRDFHDITTAVSALMKLSFDEESRQAICTLGGLQAMAEFISLDSAIPDGFSDVNRITLRRYACMSLTNLTFGDSINKTLLCSVPGCLSAIVQQLQGFNEDICQVAASVLRNLSWRADRLSKVALRQADAPRKLTEVALQVRKESSLKSILSALWNLSAHCSENKVDICSVDGALAFLVGALSYRSPSKTLAIVESAGGVLRNVSSVIAVREDLRRLLRRHDYLRVLLSHLRSPSLTIVGNACGALWNISARCREDQTALREMGAVDMLHSLVTSKHRLISTGAAAALKNLLAAEHRAGGSLSTKVTQQPIADGSCGSPKVSLVSRRRLQRDEGVCDELSDTCDNLDSSPHASPREQRRQASFTVQGATGDDTSTSERRPCNNFLSTMAAALSPGSVSDSASSSSWQTLTEGRKTDHTAVKMEKSTSEDSVGSIQSDGKASRHSPSSLSVVQFGRSASAQSTSKIEQLMKEVMQASSSASDSSSVTVRTLKGSSASSTLGGPSRSLPRCTARPPEVMSMQAPRHSVMRDSFAVNPALSPRVTKTAPPSADPQPVTMIGNYFAGLSSALSQGGMPMALPQNSMYPAIMSTLPQYCGGLGFPGDMPLPQRSAPAGPHYCNDDDNCSEKPIDYSRRYGENTLSAANLKYVSAANGAAAKLVVSGPATSAAAPPVEPTVSTSGNAPSGSHGAPFKCKQEEDVFGDHDQLRTFCTEGTPMNFLSTATSMNELNKMSFGNDDTQMDIVEEESEKSTLSMPSQRCQTSGSLHATGQPANSPLMHSANEKSAGAAVINADPSALPHRLPSEACDEGPIVYATEDTPLSFSRVSSLSNLSSGTEAIRSAQLEKPIVAGAPGAIQLAATGRTSAPMSLCLQIIREHDPPVTNAKETQGFDDRLAQAPGIEQQHKTVTFNERAATVHETPMMFSRASSLGSLSSFDVQSVHSSVVSEYSHRPSEAVSPSDLPDSPGETAPSTPRVVAKAPATFQSKVHGVINCDAKPPVASSQSSNRFSFNVVNAGGARARISVATYLDEEVTRSFADEGTPDNASMRSGLSALTFAEEEDERAPPLPPRVPHLYATLRAAKPPAKEERMMADINPEPGVSGVAAATAAVPAEQDTAKAVQAGSAHLATEPMQLRAGASDLRSNTGKESATDYLEAHHEEEHGVSSSSDGDEDMLEQCISSALPGGGRCASSIKKSASAQAVSSGTECARQSAAAAVASVPRSKTFGSKLRVPLSKTKSRRQIPAPPAPVKSVSKVGANSPTPDDDQLLAAEDCMRTFATEDTPNNFSTATSLSDLSVLDDPREAMASAGSSTLVLAPYDHESRERCSSSSDSDNSDSDAGDVLSLAISSAIPKKKTQSSDVSTSAPTGSQPRSAGPATATSSLPQTKLGSAVNASGVARAESPGRTSERDRQCQNNTAPPPIVLSPTARQAVAAQEKPQPARGAAGSWLPATESHSQVPRLQQQGTADRLAAVVRRPPPAVLRSTSSELRPGDLKTSRQGGDACDSVRIYETEGTPQNFSTATSLSDLTIDSHYSSNHGRVGRLISSEKAAPGSARPAAVAASSVTSSRQPAAVSGHSATSVTCDVLHSHSPAIGDNDSVRAYDLEGTPYSYSRRDSLSSLSCDENESCDIRSKPCGDGAPSNTSQAAGPVAAVFAHVRTSSAHNKLTENSQPPFHAAATAVQRKAAVVCNGGASAGSWKQPLADNGRQQDGLSSRDEEPAKFTPVEGTPFCYSRGSPLSSLTDDEEGLTADVARMTANGDLGADEAFDSIDAAHKAESLAASATARLGRLSYSSSGSNVSIDSCEEEADFSSAFLTQCIASAMPRKSAEAPSSACDAKAQSAPRAGSTAALAKPTHASASAGQGAKPAAREAPQGTAANGFSSNHRSATAAASGSSSQSTRSGSSGLRLSGTAATVQHSVLHRNANGDAMASSATAEAGGSGCLLKANNVAAAAYRDGVSSASHKQAVRRSSSSQKKE